MYVRPYVIDRNALRARMSMWVWVFYLSCVLQRIDSFFLLSFSIYKFNWIAFARNMVYSYSNNGILRICDKEERCESEKTYFAWLAIRVWISDATAKHWLYYENDEKFSIDCLVTFSKKILSYQYQIIVKKKDCIHKTVSPTQKYL